MENVEGDQRNTDSTEHLNSIVHEILDNLEFATKNRKLDEEEKGNVDLLNLITRSDTPCSELGQEMGSKLDDDDGKTIIDTNEASKSPESQPLENEVTDDTDKMSESHQLEILESVRKEIEMTDSYTGNINLSEQVGNFDTCTAKIIGDNNSKVEKDEGHENPSYVTQIQTEKEDLNDNSFSPASQLSQILENKDRVNGNGRQLPSCVEVSVSTEKFGSKTSILENPTLQLGLCFGKNINQVKSIFGKKTFFSCCIYILLLVLRFQWGSFQ